MTALLNTWFTIDAFNTVPIVLYTALFVSALLMLPRQDLRGLSVKFDYLLVFTGTMLAYCATQPFLIWAGWTISAIPLLTASHVHKLSRATVAAGCLALGGGIFLLSTGDYPEWAFALIMLAVIQRKGLFPLQSWVGDSFEHGDIVLHGLQFNAHLGLVIIARIALPLLPDLSHSSLMILSDIGLATAVISAVMAVAESRPRRVLAYVVTSQASSILAGLEGMNVEAITGSLMHWMVVPMATTGLLAVLRMLEVRNGGKLGTLQGYLGLGGRFPRLATFFLISGVALVGLPGTMGFISEDLLMHGALEAHPWIGLAIPVATALNAITIYRLFTRLFLGARVEALPTVPDARLRERLPLTAIVLALVVFGVFPQLAVNLRSRAAEQLVRAESQNAAQAVPGH
ncbi:cation:proton antiporter [Bryobacterales bacterium F-183]|nr:cation:proton antiporter [Bryobacterales bacterium F-183]